MFNCKSYSEGSRAHVRGYWRIKKAGISSVAVSVAAAGLLIPTVGLASASTNSCVSGAGTKVTDAAACKGLAFYKGQTITLIIPTTAGQAYDIAERVTAPYLAKFLGATVNVEDIPGGATLVGQDITAHSAPNGLTIGLMTTNTDAYDLATHIAGITFNPERERFIAGNNPQEEVVISQPNSHLSSMGDLIHSTSPVTTDSITGGSQFANGLLYHSLNIRYTWITGFTSTGNLAADFAQGTGQTWLQALASTGPLIPGKATPIMLEIPDPKGSVYTSELAGVPTYAQVIKKYPPKTAAEKLTASVFEAWITLQGFLYYAPSATPANDISALQAAAKWSFTNKSWATTMTADGLGTGYVSGATAKALFIKALKLIPRANKVVGLAG